MNISSITEMLQSELKRIIEIDKVDVNSNFYDIGGNSLLCMQFMEYVHDSFGVDLSIKDTFEKNISDIANFIGEQMKDRA